MRSRLQLAYVGIEVPDPSTLDSFFGEVIGLIPGMPDGSGAGSWRNDDKAYRILVEAGDANDATRVGFEADMIATFEETIRQLADAGYEVTEAVADEAASRLVGRLARVESAWGVTIEICHDLADAESAYSSPLMPGGFLTGGVGFGHVVFAATEFDAAHRFVTDGLGMEQSDWVDMTIAEGIEIEVRFYHCNPRHHSIALARAPFELPQKLHHVMFETTSRDDVGAAFDRVWESGLAIPNGLGMHDNDRMFSFYVASPAGFLVEVGHGARVIGDDWSDNRRYDRASRWGHQPLRLV